MPAFKTGKYSPYYFFLFWPIYLFYKLYHRKLTVVGREHIPTEKPFIFASNHQNALMDAFTVLFAYKGMVVYMTRADLFRKKWLNVFLRSISMLPVYRMRDGISSMGQNDDTFTEATELLRRGIPIGIFPEGNHAGFKRLRPLKKGVCRIAFMAEETAGFNLDLHIIPAGIDYSSYSGPGNQVLVQYGRPIRIADFIPQYRDNPQKALTALRDALTDALKPLMIHISTEDDYDTYRQICALYRSEIIDSRGLRDTQLNRFHTDKEIIAGLENSVKPARVFGEIKNTEDRYRKLLEKYNLNDVQVRKGKINIPGLILECFLSLVFLPFYLYGLLLNYLPYILPERFTRSVKDQVFHGSIHFGIRMFLFPVYHLVLLFIFSLFIKTLLLRFLFVISLPVTGMITFYYYRQLLNLLGKFRFLRLKLTQRSAFDKLIAERLQLIRLISDFLNVS